ncbi:MAG TPA: PHB depolymerase family esterase [Rugosimonospora sp.]|nr:PHB depolymerase family esterase [Rugosimonospora sp.]
MKRTLRAALAAALLPLVAGAVLVTTRPAAAAGLTQITSFGNNPSNLGMFIYVPANLAPHPALLVLMHYCGGNATAMFNSGGGQDYVHGADQFGYIIVLPQVTTSRSLDCFDVSTPEGLKRGGASDSTGIVSMVDYVKAHYPVDTSRIVLSGFSSGAMMTNVMAAEYPDVFSAGAAFSGVPATCFATGSATNFWNSTCSGGNLIQTAQQWGSAVRAMFPGYTGSYPRMQLWHGTTDTTLAYPNFGEEIKQWTNLHGLSQTPAFTDHPQSTWTRTRYGNTGTQATVEGVSVDGVGHVLPLAGMVAFAIAFLGLDGSSSAPPSSSPPASPPGGQNGTCAASYRLVTSWAGGFQAEVSVANSGTTTLSGWTVHLTLPSGQSISSLWNGVNTGTSGAVTVHNATYNGTLGASASTTFGFVATGTATTAPTVTCTSP